jgi:hypothetical protein
LVDLRTEYGYLEFMKEISIKIDEDLYRRASQKVSNLEGEVNHRVTEYLESVNGNDHDIVAARAHIADLFGATKNFSVGIRPSRDEMHQH